MICFSCCADVFIECSELTKGSFKNIFLQADLAILIGLQSYQTNSGAGEVMWKWLLLAADVGGGTLYYFKGPLSYFRYNC